MYRMVFYNVSFIFFNQFDGISVSTIIPRDKVHQAITQKCRVIMWQNLIIYPCFCSLRVQHSLLFTRWIKSVVKATFITIVISLLKNTHNKLVLVIDKYGSKYSGLFFLPPPFIRCLSPKPWSLQHLNPLCQSEVNDLGSKQMYS